MRAIVSRGGDDKKKGPRPRTQPTYERRGVMPGERRIDAQQILLKRYQTV